MRFFLSFRGPLRCAKSRLVLVSLWGSLLAACSSQVVGAGTACTEAQDCAEGQFCSQDGQCETTGASELDAGACADPPNVVFLVNRAGTMSGLREFGDAVASSIESGNYTPWDCPAEQQAWRWSVLRNVLLHPDDGIVQAREDSARFGLSIYRSEEGNLRGDTCPEVTRIIPGVDVELGGRSALLNRMGCGDLRGDTPTRESLTLLAEELAASEVAGAKVIVLVMAGEPDSCECPDWTNGGESTAASPPASCLDDGGELGQDKELNYLPAPSGSGSLLKPSAYERELLVLEVARIRKELGVFVEVVNMSFPTQTVIRDTADAIASAGDSSLGASVAAFDPVALRDALTTIVDGYVDCELN